MSNPFAVETVRCAGPGCEAVRRECNHWFVVFLVDAEFHCYPLDVDGELDPAERPVCGQACAQKLFEKFLSRKEKF